MFFRFRSWEKKTMSVTGTWNIIAKTPMGEQKATAVLTSDGTAVTGKMLMLGSSVDVFDGAVSGNSVSWKVSIDKPMPRTLEFTGTWNGNKMSGSAKAGMFGSSPFTGARGA
jgi:hypothetical protein